MSRSLVLTANYAARELELPERFLRSLRATGSSVDVVIIANHGSAEDQKCLADLMPTARLWVPIPKQRYRIFRRLATTFPALARSAACSLRDSWKRQPERRVAIEHRAAYLLNITCSRYFLARQFLHSVADQYANVMLADSRDVVFQRDPFANLLAGLTTGLESVLIKDQPANVEWLRHLYGDDSAFPMESLMNQKVICSGVTLGATADVATYLEKVCAEFMEKLPRMIHTPYLDQGVHNGLLRTGKISNAHITENGEPWIATVGTSDLREFAKSARELLTASGEPVSIVHQYDRHPVLMSSLAVLS
ncbi:MAG: hypothetical protein K9N47_07440 [Prosthecobacter sp.]|uniref:hypothetical protein n=1 Tax=Prosthecobacter sp. TaxID=1965333 RepID=UPI0025CD8030|nr:hypothetical protein [Prosthecobacter sp.]MCF7785939.1 hypothetical protein [Prosthecobacter sp.]